MTAPDPQLIENMWRFIGAKFVTKPLYAAVRLGVPDHLTAGALPIEDLARRAGAHAPSLYRVLRALASVGIFAEEPARTFRNTEASLLFLDHPGSLRPMLLWINDPRHDHAWEGFLHSVQTGETAVSKTSGNDVWRWLASQPDLQSIFNDAMASNSSNLHRAAAEAYDFSQFGTLVDVGGCQGHLLCKILEATPGLRGVVFDQPEVVAGAHTELAARGLTGRCDVVAGDFFASVPPGDAHIMSFIVHDWHDEPATRILRNIHRAQPEGGKVLLIEGVVPPGNGPDFSKLIDMEMLALANGRERTSDEFAALFDAGGYRLTRIVATGAPCAIIEAERRN